MNRRSFIQVLFGLLFIRQPTLIKAESDLDILIKFFKSASGPTSHWRFKDSQCYVVSSDARSMG